MSVICELFFLMLIFLLFLRKFFFSFDEKDGVLACFIPFHIILIFPLYLLFVHIHGWPKSPLEHCNIITESGEIVMALYAVGVYDKSSRSRRQATLDIQEATTPVPAS
jgi:hypothetical protein